MGLQQELGMVHPIENLDHESVINIVLTGELLAKEGDRLLRPFGLTDSQFNVLMLLRYQTSGGELSQTDLGRMLVVNRSNVTGLIDRMEQAGWVERGGEAGDRRVKRVRLTRAGRQLLDKAEKAYFARLHQALGSFKPEEMRTIIRQMERVRERIRQNE